MRCSLIDTAFTQLSRTQAYVRRQNFQMLYKKRDVGFYFLSWVVGLLVKRRHGDCVCQCRKGRLDLLGLRTPWLGADVALSDSSKQVQLYLGLK